MLEPELLGLPQFCRTFPRLPEPMIPREHLLDAIDTILAGETQAVFVEGSDGIGKTVVLAQYALRHSDTAHSLFIRPASRLAYAPEYLRLVLCEQIHWYLHREPLSAETTDDSLLRTKLTTLQRRAYRGKRIVFVVDGLDDIPPDESRIQEIILREILPLGLSGFAFLFSGELKRFDRYLHRSLLTKPFQLPPFTIDETGRYLANCSLASASLEEAHRLCKGIPGHLAAIRRALRAGTSFDTLLEEENLQNLPDFLALEWRSVDSATPEHKRLLAVIAFGRKGYTIDDLALLFGCPAADIKTLLVETAVIDIDPGTNEAAFLSETHRKHATHALREFKNEVIDLLIHHLQENPDTDAALTDLPGYYNQAGRLRELIEYLTPEHFTKIAQRSESFAPLHRLTELALNSATRIEKTEAVTRFSLQKAVLNQLDGAQIWRSEVEARLSLRDYDGALALAQTTVAKEDRLHLLVVVAKGQCEVGNQADPQLLQQIRLLYEQLNPADLGKRALEIATDLVAADPDLAIRMVEAATPVQTNANSLDWAFTALSLAALDSRLDRGKSLDVLEKARQKVRDPEVERFLTQASLFARGVEPSEIINRVSQLNPKNRVFVLRRWAASNHDVPHATRIVDYALDLLLQNTVDTPTTRDLRELATPLPSVTDPREAARLVGRFDSLSGAIAHLGTTRDYVRLQLLLARTQRQYDEPAAHSRLTEVFRQVNGLTDPETRSACLAWILAAIDQIDPDRLLETRYSLHTDLQSTLKTSVVALLENTAEHDDVTRDVIRALALARPALAIEIALSLNTMERRDTALSVFIQRVLGRWPLRVGLDVLRDAIFRIRDPRERDDALLETMRRLWERADPPTSTTDTSFRELVTSLSEMSAAELRCRARCYAYALLLKSGNGNGFREHLLHLIDDDWKIVDAEWDKIDLAFFFARLLGTHSPEQARHYLRTADTLRDSASLDSSATASTYLTSLDLAIRAFAGLLPRSLMTDQDLGRLTALLQRVNSASARVRLWSDLALRLVLADRAALALGIVTDHLRPDIDALPSGDPAARWKAFTFAAPALFATHRPTAYALLSTMPQPIHDEALYLILDFLFTHRPPGEPYHYIDGDGYDLTYEQATDICELLEKASEDSTIYGVIAKLCDSLTSKRNHTRISKIQRNDFAYRLEQIARTKLPDSLNIRHDGYRIAALAAIAKVRRVPHTEWEPLIAEAREIPNSSDRAFVTCLIISALASREVELAQTVALDALNLINQLEAGNDRVARLCALGEALIELNASQAMQHLRSAMEISKSRADDESMAGLQRRIIDLAHRLDPNFASSLAALIDDDPARAEARRSLRSRVELLNLKKQMIDQPARTESADHADRDYPNAAWMNLGALNAGRLEAQHLDSMRPHLDVAARFSLHRAYPIFAWVIEMLLAGWARPIKLESIWSRSSTPR